MGSKNKLKRFKENETFSNVFQPTREDLVNGSYNLKGFWNKIPQALARKRLWLLLKNPKLIFPKRFAPKAQALVALQK